MSAAERAIAGLVDAIGDVSPLWLTLGVALHLLNQVVRGRGWHAVVTAAGARPRRRDTVAAWVAGAGAGGVVSARGGDAVRVLVLAPQAGTSRALLAGTLAAEAVGDAVLGAALLAFAPAVGVTPHHAGSAGTAVYALAVIPVVAAACLLARRSRRIRALLARAAHGCALLRSPGAYVRTVLPWQTASRVLRLAALACFLAAFGLPATPAAVLLVVFAQCGGRIIPFSPAGVGAGAAILAATFKPVTGAHVSHAQVTAFFLGSSTVLTVVGTVLALAICAQASAKVGPSAAALGRLMRIRPAAAPRP